MGETGSPFVVDRDSILTTQRESRISSAIMEKLRSQGIFCFKVHGSALMMAGLPDVIVCVDGHFVGIETKVPEKRSNVSVVQRQVHKMIEAAGGKVFVVCGAKEAADKVAALRAQWLAAESPSEHAESLLVLHRLLDRRMATDVHLLSRPQRIKLNSEIAALRAAIRALREKP